MTHILALSGSLRKHSFNTALLEAAKAEAPSGVTIEIASLLDVPLYNGDDEDKDGLPTSVQRLQTQLGETNGLLIATPEYNGGIPGVLKNALDWMSRGPGGAGFRGKPVALVGATPGGLGTILSQTHLLPILRNLGTKPWFGGRLTVSGAMSIFADSELKDEATRKMVAEFVSGYAASL
ncbi:MAG: NADPH-dependent FMN reductase [Pseudomonadota bacterium]